MWNLYKVEDPNKPAIRELDRVAEELVTERLT
jgi:hypothetical protein